MQKSLKPKFLRRLFRLSLNFIRIAVFHVNNYRLVLGGIEDDYEDKLIVVKVNVNFDAELAQKYEVAASPTLLFFKEGKEVNRIRGLVKRKELEEAVEEVL